MIGPAAVAAGQVVNAGPPHCNVASAAAERFFSTACAAEEMTLWDFGQHSAGARNTLPFDLCSCGPGLHPQIAGAPAAQLGAALEVVLAE